MEDYKQEVHKQEEQKQEEQKETDRFTNLMFGSRRPQQMRNEPKESAHQESTIDFEELMMNIDTLMDSVKEFKPLFQKVYPYIEQFWKKK